MLQIARALRLLDIDIMEQHHVIARVRWLQAPEQRTGRSIEVKDAGSHARTRRCPFGHRFKMCFHLMRTGHFDCLSEV